MRQRNFQVPVPLPLWGSRYCPCSLTTTGSILDFGTYPCVPYILRYVDPFFGSRQCSTNNYLTLHLCEYFWNIFQAFANFRHLNPSQPLGKMPRSLFLDEQAPVEQTSTRGSKDDTGCPMKENVVDSRCD